MKRTFLLTLAIAALLFSGANAIAGGGHFGHFHHHKVGYTGVAGYGVAPLGVASYGVAPMGVASFGMASYGVAPMGVASYGLAPMAVNSFGVAPMGVSSFRMMNTQPYMGQSDFASAGVADEFARLFGRALLQRIIQNPPRFDSIGGDPLDSRIEELRRRVATLESDVAGIKTDVTSLKTKTESLEREAKVARKTRILVEQHDDFLDDLWETIQKKKRTTNGQK